MNITSPQTVPPHIRTWLLALAACPTLYGQEKDFPEALSKFQNIVSAYSEAFFACSYNDECVFRLLLSGDMNAEAARNTGDKPWNGSGDWFKHQLGKYFSPREGDYERQLMQAAIAAGGWPMSTYRLARYQDLLPVCLAQALPIHYPYTCKQFDLSFLQAAEEGAA